jgi:ribosomal protein L11 methyltransferase
MDCWWELEVEVPEALADDAAALLIGAGAGGVELVSLAWSAPPLLDTPPKRQPNPDRVLLVASYTEDIHSSERETQAREALALLDPALAESVDIVQRQRRDQDWRERWREFFHPRQIGERLWVVPTWEAERGFSAPPGALVLWSEPGMAFGTGQHPTTAMCLRVMEQRLESAPASKLFDVGTGSGILAIAAHKLGVPHVLGIDNDPEAIDWARQALVHNSVPPSAVVLADTPLEQVHESFDWVVANILAEVLIALRRDLVLRVAPRGHLLLSGILATVADDVIAAFAAEAQRSGRADLGLLERAAEEEWVALLFGPAA